MKARTSKRKCKSPDESLENMFRYFKIGAAFGLLIAMFGTSSVNSQVNLGDNIKQALEDQTCSSLEIMPDFLKDLQIAYEARVFRPVWITNGSLNPQAIRALSELQRSTAHGLKPEYYQHKQLQLLSKLLETEDQACFEIGMSQSFLKYSNDMANGYIRLEQYPEHSIVSPLYYDFADLFHAARDGIEFNAFLKTLLSTDDRYVRLITKLAEFLRIDARNAWPKIEKIGSRENSKPDPRVIQNLLIFTGDLSVSDVLKISQNPLIIPAAIKRFQSRHGLSVTGFIDPPTARAMKTPVSEKIAKIRINLERRRWQNRSLAPNHIYVNLGDQSIRIVRDGKKRSSAKIADQKGLKNLPTFSGEISALSINKAGNLEMVLLSEVSTELFGGKLNVALAVSGKPGDHINALLGQSASEVVLREPGDVLMLEPPIDAFVTYVTAWANKNGSISFRPDVFERDEDLAKLLGIEN